jgi:hypothetical protein
VDEASDNNNVDEGSTSGSGVGKRNNADQVPIL